MLLQTAVILALLLAVAAFQRARGLARRLDALTQSYWELKYDYTRLRSQLSRLDPEHQDELPAPPAPEQPEPVSFVPLSSIRKKEK